MKKIIAMIITSLMVSLSVAGCGGSGTAAPASETQPAEESVSESAKANDIPSSEYTDHVFKPLINMEIGTAGSSLKSAQLAEEILSFAASRQLGNTEESARKAAFSEAWNSLSSEDDYESVRGRFEDAGVGAEMEELSKDADAQKSWNALRELMSGAE